VTVGNLAPGGPDQLRLCEHAPARRIGNYPNLTNVDRFESDSARSFARPSYIITYNGTYAIGLIPGYPFR